MSCTPRTGDIRDEMTSVAASEEDGYINRVSIREQVRLLPPLRWHGVAITILDESSFMHTGSFKALTALHCVADCLRQGIREISFTSGANTGMALAAYANRLGIKTHFFLPTSNIWKLDRRYVGDPLSRVYAVTDPTTVKEVCQGFAAKTGIPLMPKLEHHRAAALRRGACIASLITEGLDVDWFAQTVCAGFGPTGIYQSFFDRNRLDSKFSIPRLLAVQQAGNCALARHLQRNPSYVPVIDGERSDGLIESTMYDPHPETYGTFPEMERTLHGSDGAVAVVSRAEFLETLGLAANGLSMIVHLRQNGIRLRQARRNGTTDIADKAGLLTVTGVLKAVRAGLIAEGATVLCSFSGGAGDGGFQALPTDRIIVIQRPFDAALDAVVNSLNKD